MTGSMTQYATLTGARNDRPARRQRDSATMAVCLAAGVARLDALSSDWQELRRSHGMTVPNTEPRIFAATVSALGEPVQPHVALFKNGAAPQAMIIARRSARALPCRLGYLTFRSRPLRSLDIVYGGLVTDGSRDANLAILEHLRALLAAGRVDHVMINHLPVSHELYAALADRSLFRSAFIEQAERHWRFTVAEGPFENTFRRFSGKHRYNMRRADRLCAEHFGGELALRRITDSPDIEAFLADAMSITGAGYQGALGAGIGDGPVQRAVLQAAAEDGRLRCYQLLGAGRAIAFQVGIVCRNVYCLQSTAFLPEFSRLSPGQVLLVRVLEDLCSAGISGVDYGFGDARYKQIYGTERADESTIHLFADTPRASSARRLQRLTAGAGRCAAYVTRCLGLTDAIRNRWRRRLSRRARASQNGDGGT